MGTKDNPGKFNCYEKALPDEPMFTLLARDPCFFEHVNKWANDRLQAIRCGERPESDMEIVEEAWKIAVQGEKWRKDAKGKWRQPK